MFVSSKYSYLALRLGLAAVAAWWAIQLFQTPGQWLTQTWFRDSPAWLANLRTIYVLASGLALLSLSLILQIFHKFFAGLAVVILLVMLLRSGLTATTISVVGLAGALLAVVLWPPQRERY